MGTIGIKIKKQDKAIMMVVIDNVVDSIGSNGKDDVVDIFLREILFEIKAKLVATSRDGKAIRLNLTQAVYFTKFLEIYARLGIYEQSNGGLLKAELEKKIREKYTNN
jgi:hypothetical protein